MSGMSKKGGYWISISDIMSALMIVFLFISVAFLAELQSQQEMTDAIVQGYAETKGNIGQAMQDEFGNDLARWGATLDKDNLSIRFDNPETLFAQGSANLSPKFQTILNEFIPRFIALISRPEFRDAIQEIRIEGHTSSEWNGQMGTDEAYFRNMELSQARTRTVLRYMINMPVLKAEKPWMMQKITANGLSFSRRIMVNGTEDMAHSRRVEFRIRTNSEEKMQQLKEHYDKTH